MEMTPLELNMWQRSIIRRFLRWLFRRRTVGIIGFVIFCLVTLVFLFVAEENWRGRRAWETYRLEWEAKGERFDLASIIPKPVPPEQNFAMTPLLAPLLDYDYEGGAVRWRDSNAVARTKSITVQGAEDYQGESPDLGNWQMGEFCDMKAWQAFCRTNANFPSSPQPQEPARDVLFALGKYDPVFAELHAASRRPYAVYPIHYDETVFSLLPQLSVLKSLTRVVELRALANLEAGRNEEALADAKLAFHLAASLKTEPLLISHLVQVALIQITLQPVWEGLTKHQWTEAQLCELQQTLASLDLLADYGIAMRGERAFANELLAQWRAGRLPGVTADQARNVPRLPRWLMPNGFFYQNQLAITRLHQQVFLPAVDAQAHRVYREKCDTNAIKSVLGRRTPYNMLAQLLFPAVQKLPARAAQCQTWLDLATVACALERYRLAHGGHPESLDALVPQFIASLPHDIVTGQPLKYRGTDDGQFVIYSVGWNEMDDGGQASLTKNGNALDWQKGDWVWQYPAK